MLVKEIDIITGNIKRRRNCTQEKFKHNSKVDLLVIIFCPFKLMMKFMGSIVGEPHFDS